jgi:hypothetical protein
MEAHHLASSSFFLISPAAGIATQLESVAWERAVDSLQD